MAEENENGEQGFKGIPVKGIGKFGKAPVSQVNPIKKGIKVGDGTMGVRCSKDVGIHTTHDITKDDSEDTKTNTRFDAGRVIGGNKHIRDLNKAVADIEVQGDEK